MGYTGRTDTNKRCIFKSEDYILSSLENYNSSLSLLTSPFASSTLSKMPFKFLSPSTIENTSSNQPFIERQAISRGPVVPCNINDYIAVKVIKIKGMTLIVEPIARTSIKEFHDLISNIEEKETKTKAGASSVAYPKAQKNSFDGNDTDLFASPETT